MSVSHTDIQGNVADGFGRVADAFRRNFEQHGDRGAACTVIIDGKTVVDLYGGESRPGTVWTPDTRSVLFSVSKGITAICLIMASERGHLDLDLPVARYWPEFAAHGKDRLTIRQLLAHRAGLIYPSEALTSTDLGNWTPVTQMLASQEPQWKPDESFAYHPVTMGFLAGEVLRRATGLKPSQWLAEHIAGPLRLTMSFGVKGGSAQLAQLLPPTTDQAPPYAPGELLIAQKAATMSGAFELNFIDETNMDVFLNSESPGANLVSSAHDVARLYAATVSSIDGTRLIHDDSIRRATEPLSQGQPFFGLDEGNIWGTGFMLPSPRRLLAGPGSFGHDGTGGQLAFASPAHRLGFAYQTVQLGLQDDPRAELLSQALLTCL